jgi:hypothetical protein
MRNPKDNCENCFFYIPKDDNSGECTKLALKFRMIMIGEKANSYKNITNNYGISGAQKGWCDKHKRVTS